MASHLRHLFKAKLNNLNGGIHLTSVHTIYELKCKGHKTAQTLYIVVTPVK